MARTNWLWRGLIETWKRLWRKWLTIVTHACQSWIRNKTWAILEHIFSQIHRPHERIGCGFFIHVKHERVPPRPLFPSAWVIGWWTYPWQQNLRRMSPKEQCTHNCISNAWTFNSKGSSTFSHQPYAITLSSCKASSTGATCWLGEPGSDLGDQENPTVGAKTGKPQKQGSTPACDSPRHLCHSALNKLFQ